MSSIRLNSRREALRVLKALPPDTLCTGYYEAERVCMRIARQDDVITDVRFAASLLCAGGRNGRTAEQIVAKLESKPS